MLPLSVTAASCNILDLTPSTVFPPIVVIPVDEARHRCRCCLLVFTTFVRTGNSNVLLDDVVDTNADVARKDAKLNAMVETASGMIGAIDD